MLTMVSDSAAADSNFETFVDQLATTRPSVFVNKANTTRKKEGNGESEGNLDGYPQGSKFFLLTISLILAVFIMTLDTTIICKYSVWIRRI